MTRSRLPILVAYDGPADADRALGWAIDEAARSGLALRVAIVVGVDGSPTSFSVLTFACRRAEQTGDAVLAVHGFRVRTPSTAVWSSEPRSISEATTEKELMLAESIASLRTAHPDVHLVHEVIPVGPATLLIDASLDASVVVVGSRGLGPFGAMLLGSVSQHGLHREQCRVAMIR